MNSDWKDNHGYDYTARLSRREWAWEFLRRNACFCEARRTCQLEYGILGYDAATTMLVSQFETPPLTAWGLLYSYEPDPDALTDIVFWSPELCSSVLRMTAFPLSARIDATPFLLRDIACASVLLDVPSGPQHLLFADEGRGLQLLVEGEEVVRPVRLLTNGAPKADLASAQLRSLHCFNELRLTGRLSPSSVQRDPLSPRLRHVLRVLDADLSGAGREEIGEVLLAEGRASERWQGSGRALRDYVRRALRRGQDLMRRSYRDLLS